jgi:glycosyltransferase involved in cell wall biosynthesis
VLHYLCSPIRGGVEEHALSLLTALPDYGMRPYVAGPSMLLERVKDELEAAQVRVFPVERTALYDWRKALRFVAFLRRERIALVHSHMFIGSIFASPLARLARAPAVVETFHLRETWREGKWLKGNFWIDRQISRFVDVYIAVSNAVREHLENTKSIPPAKIRTIYNGRDLARFRPPSADEAARIRTDLGLGNRKMVLVLARLEPQKGHVYMIEAARILAATWPQLTVLFAGAGQLESELRKACDEAMLGGRIRFVGFRPDSARLLAAADVVVLPSLFEGLPLVAIEALATACPMVATNIEGTREIVIDEVTGLLVPPANSDALAGAIDRLLRDRAFARRLGAQGRSLVEQRFSLKAQLDSTVAVYREVLELNNHRQRQLIAKRHQVKNGLRIKTNDLIG